MKSDNRPDMSIKARSELECRPHSLSPTELASGDAMRICVTQDMCPAGWKAWKEESIIIH